MSESPVANPATAANELTDGAAVRRFAALATDSWLVEQLTSAINRACAARGDDEANRLALLAECWSLDVRQQLDLLEHFRAQAAIWERATGEAA